jgi:hypothetical protein
MPRGARPCERRGGRKKGTPNKVTVGRRLAELAALEEAKRAEATKTEKSPETSAAQSVVSEPGRRKAINVLDELMQVYAGMAAHVQPRPPHLPPNPYANEALFHEYARLAGYFADRLAPYQSPTFRAVAVTIPAAPAAAVVESEDNVINLDDPIALSRVYRRMIAGK